MTITASNLLWIPVGTRFPVIRPIDLATDWSWTIVERDNPAEILDFSPVNVANAIRHQFIDIDDRYTPDTVYEIRVLNAAAAVVTTGDFQVVQAAFGPDALVNYDAINNSMSLAAGLSDLNTRVQHSRYDRTTGIPLQSDITIYTDETLSVQLATYRILRRLNAVGLIVGQMQYRREFDPSAPLEIGS